MVLFQSNLVYTFCSSENFLNSLNVVVLCYLRLLQYLISILIVIDYITFTGGLVKLVRVGQVKFIKNDKSDYILLLIWHFNKYIIKKIKKITKNKKIIIPFPKIRII